MPQFVVYSTYASVAQWIERWPPEPGAVVRFHSGAFHLGLYSLFPADDILYLPFQAMYPRKDMMNFENFKQSLLQLVNSYLPESYHAELTNVKKNNNITLQAICIKNESNIAPTIYIEEIYEDYKSGGCQSDFLDSVARQLAELALYSPPFDSELLNNINDFSVMKERLCFKLVNTKRNSEYLEKVISVPFLDLSLLVICTYEDEDPLSSSSVVTRELAKGWGVSDEEIIMVAAANSPFLIPPEFTSINHFLPQLPDQLSTSISDLYVLTGKSKRFGAVCITYPDMLEQICNIVGGSYFIIPSSIHEVIIHPGNYSDKQYIDQMINDVNAEALPETYFLSDHAYFYDAEVGRIIY